MKNAARAQGMWRKDFTGKIHTTFSPLRLTDIARYVKRTDRIPHIRIGSCGVSPAQSYTLPTVAAQKKARGYRARIVWLRRVKSALRPHGLPPREKCVTHTCPALVRRVKRAFARRGWLCRIKALRKPAPHWFAVACSECAAAARPFLPIALPAARRAPIFFYASRENSAKTFYKRPSV